MACSTDYWSELDGEVLRLLAERPGGLSFEEIGHKLGTSEDAVRTISSKSVKRADQPSSALILAGLA